MFNVELTIEEKEIIVNLLNEISVPIKQSQLILNIINKLTLQINEAKVKEETIKEEKK